MNNNKNSRNFSAYNDYKNMPMYDGDINNSWFCKKIKSIKGLEIVEDYIVKININNSKLIEEEINKNEDYNLDFHNPNRNLNFYTIVFDHYKKVFNHYKNVANIKVIPPSDETAILALIRMIDWENSTNAWRMKGNHRQSLLNMVAFIMDIQNGFWRRLKKGDIKLVDELTDAAQIYKGQKGVDSISLSSKICKYFNELLYQGDAYYINDQVVRRVLPYYLNYYDVEINTQHTRSKIDIKKLTYEELFKWFEALRNSADKNLTRSQFDHILWYCYRKEKV